MSHPKKIVLHCANGYSPRINSLVEEFLRDDVIFVGVVGRDCARIEDIIDELVVGYGSRDHHLLTSSHPNETTEAAISFAESLTGKLAGTVHVLHA